MVKPSSETHQPAGFSFPIIPLLGTTAFYSLFEEQIFVGLNASLHSYRVLMLFGVEAGLMKVIAVKAMKVEITLTDGSLIAGNMFVPLQGRLSDTLNDSRMFFPVEMPDGSCFAVAKQSVQRILMSGREAKAGYEGSDPRPGSDPYRDSDPYRILGVTESVSWDGLKKAYRCRCTENHPDRIRALNLAPEFEKLATENMVRINQAYAQLEKTRQQAA